MRRASPKVQPAGVKAAQLKFRAPEALRDQIETAAKSNGWGTSEEIRRRLEVSFAEGQSADDPKSRELLSEISYVLNYLSNLEGKWHEDPYLFLVLKAAIETLFARRKPEGDPKKPHPGSDYSSFRPGQDPPETAGRMLANIATTGWAERKQ
jgi:hypothetical protein